MKTLTQSRLKELLSYNPETGFFVWKADKGQRGKEGSVAGTLRADGYIHIGIDKARYLAHRLAWLYVKGYFPEHGLDHKNGFCDDNRWKNLREVGQTCNQQNVKRRLDNTSGIPGVTWNKQNKKWVAQIQIHKKRVHLGYYNFLLEAGLARYTVEQWCKAWHCDCRNETYKAIKLLWPKFEPKTT